MEGPYDYKKDAEGWKLTGPGYVKGHTIYFASPMQALAAKNAANFAYEQGRISVLKPELPLEK